MGASKYEVGRVLRVGPGWADVTVGRRVRRVTTHLTSPISTGSYLKIVNGVGGPAVPAPAHRAVEQVH